MTETFFYTKQGGCPTLGALAGKGNISSPIDPPSFFSSHPLGIAMDTPLRDKYVVDLPSVIKSLRHQIQRTKNYIKFYLSEPHAFEEVFRGKEQLRQQEKLLSEVEETLRCQ